MEHRPSSSLGARTLLCTSVWTAWRLHGQWDEGAERRLLWRRWGGWRRWSRGRRQSPALWRSVPSMGPVAGSSGM